MSKNERPSSNLLRVAPVLDVNSRSVRKMRDFFVDQLGFTVGTEVGSGPKFVTLDRDGQTIMLNCRFSFGFRKRDWAAYFWTDDVSGLFDEVRSRGAEIKSGLVNKDYGCREFVVIAPDGREIVFGQLLPE